MVLAQKILNPKLMQFHLQQHQLGTLALVKLLGAQLSTRTPRELMTRLVVAPPPAPALQLEVAIPAEIEAPALTRIAIVMLLAIQQIILIAPIILISITQTPQVVLQVAQQAGQAHHPPPQVVLQLVLPQIMELALEHPM